LWEDLNGLSSGEDFVFDPVVAFFFEFEGEAFAAGEDDLAIHEDVDDIGLNIVEEALVVGDEEEATVGGAHGVDAAGDNFEGVDVEAGVGLVEDGVFGFQHHELEDLVAFFLATGEALVDGAAGEGAIHLQLVHARVELFVEGDGVDVLALGEAGFESGAEEVGVGDAGDFVGVLEGEEEASAGAFIDGHGEDVLAVEGDGAAGDFVLFVAGENFGEGAFAGAIGAHDGVDFTGVDGEGQAVEDLTVGDLGGEVIDDEGHEAFF
jgi:hypothetical protein